MQFQHTIKQVLDGSKSQTRRRVKPRERYDDRSALGLPPAVFTVSNLSDPAPRVKWRVGQTLAVQPGRGKTAIARIRITGIRCEDVRNISDEDARAEGFVDADDFLELWCQMHDPAILPFYTAMYRRGWLTPQPAYKYQAWCLTFELVTADAAAQETRGA